MKDSQAALQKELDALLARRDRLREKQFNSYVNSTHTRAQTTTSNAEVDRLQDRIEWLRHEIKKAA